MLWCSCIFHGDFESVNHLIIENIEYFESFIDEVDAILVPEATCAAMIWKIGKNLWQKTPLIKKESKNSYPKFIWQLNG